MSIKCCRCGAVTEIEQSFYKTRRSFTRQKVYFCPPCWAKQQQRLIQSLLLLWVAVCPIYIAIVVLEAEDSPLNTLGWIGLNLSLGYLFLLLQIIPHELGHAFAACLLGWRVFKITIGQGRNICRFRWRKILIEINAIPTIGITWATSKSAVLYRLKRFLFVLAGPLTNAAMLLAVLLFLPAWWQLFEPLHGTKLFLWIVSIGSCLLLLIGNLYPSRLTAILGSVSTKLETDGLALLTAFFLSPADIRQRQASYFGLEGDHSFLQRDYQAAKQWHEQGLELCPEDIPNRYRLALVLLFLKEFHAARTQWLLLLERQDLPPALRATLVNNLAWTDMVIGGKELLAEADRLSQEAIRDQPWSPIFQGTRGSVLIELGQADEGLPLVQRAFDANEDPRFKALNACYLALGECQRGNSFEGQHHREVAHKLDPECILLDKVDQAVAAVASSV